MQAIRRKGIAAFGVGGGSTTGTFVPVVTGRLGAGAREGGR